MFFSTLIVCILYCDRNVFIWKKKKNISPTLFQFLEKYVHIFPAENF